MVTNFDVVLKEHPNVVRECLERRKCNLKVSSDGKISSCTSGSYCDSNDCIFSDGRSYAPYSDGEYFDGCVARITHWLNKPASIAVDDCSDIRNKDGDITW